MDRWKPAQEADPVEASRTALREAALGYAEGGWRVLPITAGRKAPPLARHGSKNATNDADSVRWVWSLYPRANVAVATGGGLAVIDVDSRNGGEADPSWPATLTARTPSGGFHLFYVVGDRVRNSVSRLAPGVDVRGDGGYVLVAPSVVDGRPYEWVDTRPPVAVDAGMFLPADAPARGRTGGGRELPAGWAPYDPPEVVREGGRNNELLRYAGWLWSAGFDADELEDALFDFNAAVCLPPLPDDEVLSIFRRHAGWQR